MAAKKSSAGLSTELLPPGVIHLGGTLYQVPFASLVLPEDDNPANKEYIFSNPRSLTERGNSDLFDVSKSRDIRDSIKRQGLLNPIACRWKKNEAGNYFPQIIAGERRYRAIDSLVEKDEIVLNPSATHIVDGVCKRVMEPASKVYENIVANIYVAENDIDALGMSWAENANRHNLTDGHEIAVVIKLRKYKASDDDILNIMGKDAKWLRDTDKLISKLDPKSLKLFLEDKIDRGGATKLLEVIDETQRSRVVDLAIDASEAEAAKENAALDQKIETAEYQQRVAAKEKALAEKFGQDAVVATADAIMQRQEAKINKIHQEKEKIRPVATGRLIRNAIHTIGNEPAKKSALRSSQIEKLYIPKLEKLLLDGGVYNDHEVASESTLLTVIQVLKSILDGEENVMIPLLNAENLIIEDEVDSIRDKQNQPSDKPVIVSKADIDDDVPFEYEEDTSFDIASMEAEAEDALSL